MNPVNDDAEDKDVDYIPDENSEDPEADADDPADDENEDG